MTTVGFIGSGAIGSAIARLAVEAGHQVVLSNSRGPDTLAELGPQASAVTSGQAAAAGDIVVVTVPVKAFPDLPAAPLAGKTVIGTCSYGPEPDGPIPELDGTSLSSSELLLRYLPDAMIVKAFNNIFFEHLLSLARPAGAGDRSYLPIVGDSAPAKAAVTEFIEYPVQLPWQRIPWQRITANSSADTGVERRSSTCGRGSSGRRGRAGAGRAMGVGRAWRTVS